MSAVNWDGAEDAPPASGRSLSLLAGGYEPLVSLAAGGMAHVFVGRRVSGSFERLVVIKQVHRHFLHEREFANLFRDEAQIASRIHHANVVPVVDVVEAPDELLLVMDYVESVSLAVLRRTACGDDADPLAMPAPIVSRIVIDVLSGLHAAHELVDEDQVPLDVVHRDVSPQNVIVGVDGVSRVIDFGVAKAAHRITKRSESGDIKGKYGYMSPEQASGLDVDRRTDVFAAGVVLFETLTNQRLFTGANPLDSLHRVLNAALPDFERTPGIPAALAGVLKRALDRNRQRRFTNAMQFAEAVEAAVPPAPHRQVADFVREHCGRLLQDRKTILEESRRRTPSALRTPRSHAPALEMPDVATLSNSAATVTSVATSSTRGRRWSLLILGALVVTVSTIAVWGLEGRKPVIKADEPAASPPASTSEAAATPAMNSTVLPVEAVTVIPASATASSVASPSEAVATASASAPRRPVRASPAPRPAALPSKAPPAVSSPRSELQQDPYK